MLPETLTLTGRPPDGKWSYVLFVKLVAIMLDPELNEEEGWVPLTMW